MAKRVLIIGLDGATFDVLDPMIESGRMPNLKALIARGTRGVLESTRPPITPAAWTTFMTGLSPGGHGVVDFERYDVRTGELRFNSHMSIGHVRTIWQILGDRGFRVGTINVPMTYPPQPVNGFAISGFETPSTAVEFTWPRELKDEILRRWPDYTFKNKWHHRWLGGDDVLAGNLGDICNSFHQAAEVTRFCGERHGWDVLMVVLKLVDNLQHKTWRYLDPRFNRRHGRRAGMVADCFRHLDQALGDMFAYADEHQAHVLIMSDHGHGSLEGKAQPNLLLKQWGYLQLRSDAAQIAKRAGHLIRRAFGTRRGRFAANRQIDTVLAVDFARTRACVMHAGMYGFLYLNLRGRQPEGIVSPEEYEPLRDELRERFLNVTIPTPRGLAIKLFAEVYKPEELYDCSREGREWMPDLMLVPTEGLAVVRGMRGSRAVRWFSERKIEGTHRLEGMFAAAGDRIAAGRTTRARLIDCPPTILAMMGLGVPAEMEGRVLADMFEPPLEHETESRSAVAKAPADEPVYSAAEEQVLTQRLADLGYLE